MTGFLGAAYLWVKAAHLIFVIFWMASMFILPRYLVHLHGEPELADRWGERIGRLRRVIMTPSMLIVWLLGIALIVNIGLVGNGWLHAKLLIVFLFSGFHGWLIGLSRKMLAGERPVSEKSLRLMNEIPSVVVISVVILAVVKPF
ncbi:CopD family protein [Pacificimonas sp. WHA3]|uniref:Protoporphyrinogen IX oxidase n=1 Tax=Pacificimonas pallii TaxID=2827236 RepID=A0ABS6SBG3_9SPHN|nr:CopD family protein [Pacificimonas pallii]MBV7255757.1 CopD family protein [Pacificimonas pallii]